MAAGCWSELARALCLSLACLPPCEDTTFSSLEGTHGFWDQVLLIRHQSVWDLILKLPELWNVNFCCLESTEFCYSINSGHKHATRPGQRWKMESVYAGGREREGYLRELKITGSRNKSVHQKKKKEKWHVFSYSQDLDEKSHAVFWEGNILHSFRHGTPCSVGRTLWAGLECVAFPEEVFHCGHS